MISDPEQVDIKLFVAGVGMLCGCIIAVMLSACNGTARDAGVDGTQTSTTTSTTTTSTKT